MTSLVYLKTLSPYAQRQGFKDNHFSSTMTILLTPGWQQETSICFLVDFPIAHPFLLSFGFYFYMKYLGWVTRTILSWSLRGMCDTRIFWNIMFVLFFLSQEKCLLKASPLVTHRHLLCLWGDVGLFCGTGNSKKKSVFFFFFFNIPNRLLRIEREFLE
jgi:hypothetical protein